MGRDGRDVRHTTDRDGNTWLTDASGNIIHDASGDRIPGPPETLPDPISGFTTFDSSQGHCGFCGKLTCTGNCFK